MLWGSVHALEPSSQIWSASAAVSASILYGVFLDYPPATAAPAAAEIAMALASMHGETPR